MAAEISDCAAEESIRASGEFPVGKSASGVTLVEVAETDLVSIAGMGIFGVGARLSCTGEFLGLATVGGGGTLVEGVTTGDLLRGLPRVAVGDDRFVHRRATQPCQARAAEIARWTRRN